MADAKITALTADASPTSDDLVPTVTDPGGTPANRKVTAANLITKAHGLIDGAVVSVVSGILVSNQITATVTELNFVDGVTSNIQTQLDSKQPADSDLTAIAALTPTNDDFMQRKAGAWTNRTPTQVTADLIAFVGDSGSGGTKGLVPAPATGDAAKFLRGDGTWVTISGGGDALTSNPLSQFAPTTSAQLAGVISDETGSGALVFATSPTLITPALGTPSSGTLTNCTGLPQASVIGLTTADSPQFAGLNIGHASDTTLSRTGAGDIAVEGNAIYRAGGTDVPVTDGGTGASTATAARVNLGVMNIVVLASDYTNSNAVANTLEDVTDFKFPVVNGGTYYFHIVTDLTTAATSTGFRVAINGPAATRMSYRNVSGLTATTQTIAHGLTSYSLPAASGATSAATGGTISVIEGFITPSASGDVQVQIASEVSASAVTAKAGSIIEWYRCL